MSDSMNRRQCVATLVAGGAVVALTGSASAQLGGIGGGNNNNNKKKKRRKPPQQIKFNVSGEGKTRFAFDLKPTGTGGMLQIDLMTYNEKYKRFEKAMGIGTFKQALKKTTAGIKLRPGQYALQMMGGAFEYSITVEHGKDESYSKVAHKSGKV